MAAADRSAPRSTARDRRPIVALGLVASAAFVALRAALAGRRRAARAPRRGALPDRRFLARRRRRTDAAWPGLRVRPAPAARARRDPAPRGEHRRGLRLVQGGERALLRADGRARVPPRPPARLAMVGRAGGSPRRRHSVVDLRRDRDDREPLVPDHRVGALRDRARARAAERPPSVRRARDGRGRATHKDAVRDPLRHLGRRARMSLAARARDEAADARRSPAVLAHGAARRARCPRVRRAARLRQLGQGHLRRVLGAVARLRPVRGRQVVRLPPR